MYRAMAASMIDTWMGMKPPSIRQRWLLEGSCQGSRAGVSAQTTPVVQNALRASPAADSSRLRNCYAEGACKKQHHSYKCCSLIPALRPSHSPLPIPACQVAVFNDCRCTKQLLQHDSDIWRGTAGSGAVWARPVWVSWAGIQLWRLWERCASGGGHPASY